MSIKMEKSNESIITSEVRSDDLQGGVSAKDVGREFVRHYYTMLSEKPSEAGRFYSHESYFVHHDMPEVCGNENIQKAIQQLGFADCKARIFSMMATYTINNGLVLQVSGELAKKGSYKRRFCQTFVLYEQMAKKFYVHNDMLRWIDEVPDESYTQPKLETAKTSCDHQLNGHKTENSNESMSIDGRNDEAEPEAVDKHPLEAQHNDHSSQTLPQLVETSKAEEAIPAATKSESKSQELDSKTWAQKVASSTNGKPNEYPPIQTPRSPVLRQEQPSPNNTSVDHRRHIERVDRGTSNRDGNRPQQQYGRNVRFQNGPPRSERTLFVSNLPLANSAAEWEKMDSELHTAFEKYGQVQSISIPLSVRAPNAERRYAFVDMEEQKGIDEVLGDCRKDEHLRTYLKIALPSFEWDKEVHIKIRTHDERNGPPNRSFQSKYRGNYGDRRHFNK